MKKILIGIVLLSAFFACKKEDDTPVPTPTPVDYSGTYSGTIKVSYPDPWDTTITNFVFNITKAGENYTITSAADAGDNAIFTVTNETINRVSGNLAFKTSLTGTISATELKIQFAGADNGGEAFTGTYTGTKTSGGSGGTGGNTSTEQYGYIVYNGTKYDGQHMDVVSWGSKGCVVHSTSWKGTQNGAEDEMINIILPAAAGTYSSDGCGDPRSSGNPNDWVAIDLPYDLSDNLNGLMGSYYYKSGSVKKTIEGEYEVIEFDLVVVNSDDANKTTSITGKMRAKDN